jgi:hypothetical protein
MRMARPVPQAGAVRSISWRSEPGAGSESLTSLGVADPELDLQERLHDVPEFRYVGLVDLARRLTMDKLVAAASMVAYYGAPRRLGSAEGRGEALAYRSNV